MSYPRRSLLARWLFVSGPCLLPVAGCLLAQVGPAADALATPQQRSLALERVSRPGPLVIAHRGFSARAPENTLPSFRLALAARADLIELDYHHTRDDVAIVIHDGTLDRTTDATNRWGGKGIAVRQKNAAELADLDAGVWFGTAFAGTRLPTLVEAVETIQSAGCTLIERKAGPADTLVRLLRERDWLKRVVVQSFDWEFVRAAHALAPDLVLGALGPPSHHNGRKLTDPEKELTSGFIDELIEAGATLIVWNRQVSAEAARLVHERGRRLWVYTIDDPDEAARLVALGVDGIITNDPERIRRRLDPEPDELPEVPTGRTVPVPLPDHPGNVFLEGEEVVARWPEGLPPTATHWRLLDGRHRALRTGMLPGGTRSVGSTLPLGRLAIGWYRIEFGTVEQPAQVWTTAAVLARLRAPIPGDSPIALDSAAAWFARDNLAEQRELASLAALAGVNWVRDRLRWRDLQPAPGPLQPAPTTYDTSAEVQRAAGLKVLQTFHDTPAWARETSDPSGQFAGDLRRVYELGRSLAARFRGQVAAWEPWNEANVATFGGHTVDQMCAWQKAAWLGFKAGDPNLIVGWNPTAAVPTPAHTEGVVANEVWPYFDTYNIHTYDWSHAYPDLWAPARDAASGRPLWITEADRGTPHLKQAPWFDQDPRLERLKAEWMAQSYASSLFAGARRHFHFILGHYHEPNGVQFGLLRLDRTPRPAYVALAAIGRCLAGGHVLGRWRPGQDVQVYAFRAQPDGREADVLVLWAEKEVDWDARGTTTADWALPENLRVREVLDHLGRSRGVDLPRPLTSAPVFVLLPPGQALTLPLEPPPALAERRAAAVSPVVFQLSVDRGAVQRVDDLPWSEGYVYRAVPGEALRFALHTYNFALSPVAGQLEVERLPAGWEVTLETNRFQADPLMRTTVAGSLRIPPGAEVTDGWLTLRGQCGEQGRPVIAFRARRVPQ